jgi:hypothetical protein
MEICSSRQIVSNTPAMLPITSPFQNRINPKTSPDDFPTPRLVFPKRLCVLSPVNFDCRLRGRAGEIHNVLSDRMLTTKSMRRPEFAQFSPQPPLGLRHIPSQAPCAGRSPLNPHSISIRTAAYSTGCASATRICATRPGRCARIWFITFIASMISSGCPSATESPRRTKGGAPGCGAR